MEGSRKRQWEVLDHLGGSWKRLGGSFRPLGGVLGAPADVLGDSWILLWESRSRLADLEGVLEASLGALGPQRSPKCLPNDAQTTPK